MEVIPGIEAWRRLDASAVVTIGMFDGVHRGHRRIIEIAHQRARDLRLRCVVFTFDRHPLETLKPGKHPPYLSSSAQKLRLLEELDVDLVLMSRFDAKFAAISADSFFDNILRKKLGAEVVVVGENFHFGREGEGDIDYLKKLGDKRGVEIIAVPLLKEGKEVISSTSIRRLLEKGEVEEANHRLGWDYTLEGFVVHGDHRGKSLGFPTANLDIHDQRCVPANGVYAGEAVLEHRNWPAGIYIGSIPTFKGRHRRRVEVHLLDFEGDLYDRYLGVEFQRRIRAEMSFPHVSELQRQIAHDLDRVREFHEGKR
jgi:riboflavin kinase/FMN adenylyltransferase